MPKKDGYGWLVTPKPEPLQIRTQLPKGDFDELQRMREQSDSMLTQHRFPDQDNRKDVFRQMGAPMHSNELVRKVTKINPGLFAEDSLNLPGNAAFYYADETGQKKYTNANFRKGILPEFSIIETDAADLPVRVQYGWREVLNRLMQAKQLTMAAVLKVFGDAQTAPAIHWRQNAQKYRN